MFIRFNRKTLSRTVSLWGTYFQKFLQDPRLGGGGGGGGVKVSARGVCRTDGFGLEVCLGVNALRVKLRVQGAGV